MPYLKNMLRCWEEDGCLSTAGSRLKTTRQKAKLLGFTFFMAWCYHTLFLSAFGIAREPLWCAAWVWACLEGPLAVAGIASALLLGRFPRLGGAPAGVAAGLCATVGSALVGVGHLFGEGLSAFTAVGEALCGVAIAVMTATWGAWISAREEDESEATMVLSFGLASVVCVALLCTGGYLRVVLNILLALAAAVLTFADFGRPCAADDALADATPPVCAERGRPAVGDRRPLANVASVFALYGLLWFLFSYFRILAAPSMTGGDELFPPFALAFVFAGAGLGLCIVLSGHVNFTLIYRWALPLVVLSCGVLYVVDAEFGRSLAYLVNFVAMFGAQACCWIAGAKYVHRVKASPSAFFGGLVAAEGVGVTVGVAAGLSVVGQVGYGQTAGVSLLLVGAVLLATMLVGFKPCWILPASRMHVGDKASAAAKTQERPACPARGQSASEPGAASTGGGAFYDLLGREARFVRDEYGLTKRETEVAFLLLEGRNRPYIRDELIISLHTVHAHARSIFAKCGVHSQQELIDLVRPRAVDDVLEGLEEPRLA